MPSGTSRKLLTKHLHALHSKPEDKDYQLTVGDGLSLLVKTNGSKLWRFRYYHLGKQQCLSLGSFPETSLEEARTIRDEYRQIVAKGFSPLEYKKEKEERRLFEESNTFKALAEDWLRNQNHRATTTLSKASWLLSFAVLEFGNLPLEQITPPMILKACRKLEAEGKHETARRVKIKAGQVFRYGVALGKASRDPTADLRGILTPPQVSHRAAIIEPKLLGKLLCDIDAYKGNLITHQALKLAPLVFVRPGELRAARWKDIDFEKAIWSYVPPKTRNQTSVELIVPLARQSIQILRETQLLTGDQEFVFSGTGKEGHLSEAAVLTALKRMGYGGQVTGHGFRATARTLLDEELHYRIELIEQQLAHKVADIHGRAYNRTRHLPERTSMMQHWADYLDSLRAMASTEKG